MCEIEDCEGRSMKVSNWCRKHHMRWAVYGDPLALPTWATLETRQARYSAQHRWLKETYGRAATHECVDCSQRADEWSWIGQDCEDAQEAFQKGRKSAERWCVHDHHYEPRCLACHHRLDGIPRTARALVTT